MAVNYLLGKLGKSLEQTVAMMDMGGGSMQMAYAVPANVAANAPLGYVRPVTYADHTYNLYVKSYPGEWSRICLSALVSAAPGCAASAI
jgi:apyrase